MTTDHSVLGFDAAGMAAGIKKNGKPDLALIASRVPCKAAAVFTQNKFPAAPVLYDRQVLAHNPEGVHGVVINAGCANACTGVPGKANARLMAEWTERALGSSDQSVFVMSTGVIGVQLPIEKLQKGIPDVAAKLTPDGWDDAANAIMTTDTRPKLFSHQVEIDGQTVSFTGIVKGAGMIHPNMATMLSVIATDVAIAQPLLQDALKAAVDKSYNRISIDGDTSTNDTVLVLANGLAGNAEISDADSSSYAAFVDALTHIAVDLAQAVVRDGEGVTKFVTVNVSGAMSDGDAHTIANSIATSPLVKTAFFGNDANWGRILCAAGYAGVDLDPDRADLVIRDNDGASVQLVKAGLPTDYQEKDAAAIFAQPEFTIDVVLGLGEGDATVWTCDLSHEYVTINGDYRT
ncbi:MAG: bifunctional glutamate N-acetyltransferase/amino-acid acetyltransferase ArgJ [Caldilineaceae bacterium]|nr:bifunctional glutamate N-acetyltransferase/amino-acid acetyltransferase ArgJ [Caldilineaceae bacterium]